MLYFEIAVRLIWPYDKWADYPARWGRIRALSAWMCRPYATVRAWWGGRNNPPDEVWDRVEAVLEGQRVAIEAVLKRIRERPRKVPQAVDSCSRFRRKRAEGTGWE